VYIYLSPSSQNKNIGFGEYLSEEYRMNQMAQHLKKYLLEAGIKILPDLPPVTKKQLDDPNYNRPSLRGRLDESMRLAKELEKTEPDALFYHIALHSNAANQKARGIEIFIDPANPKSVAMAECLLESAVALYHKDNPEVAAAYGNNAQGLKRSRGVKDTGRLIEAHSANTKNGMLIELGFHDEEHDSKWMLRCLSEGEKAGGTNPLAKAMSDAIVDFVNRQ
jgi:N-acetylmuramoyl-L-alanine amidase